MTVFWVWKKELTVRSSTLPLFSFLSSQCFPLGLVCEGCLLESRDLWPLAAAHMFAVKPLDWIMPVFMKWGEETLAKSWPQGTLFLCGLIWAVPAERTAKKDSRKYFLCISLWHDFIWFLWYFYFLLKSFQFLYTQKLIMYNAALFKTSKNSMKNSSGSLQGTYQLIKNSSKSFIERERGGGEEREREREGGGGGEERAKRGERERERESERERRGLELLERERWERERWERREREAIERLGLVSLYSVMMTAKNKRSTLY